MKCGTKGSLRVLNTNPKLIFLYNPPCPHPPLGGFGVGGRNIPKMVSIQILSKSDKNRNFEALPPPHGGGGVGGGGHTEKLASDSCSGPSKASKYQISSKSDEKKFTIF